MDLLQKEKSIAAVCIGCKKVIILLSSTNNIKANWEGMRHISDVDLGVVICKKCYLDTSISATKFISKKDLNRTGAIWKIKNAVTGTIDIIGSSKKIPVLSLNNIFENSPAKFQLAIVTGSRNWPTSKIITAGFI